MKGKYTTANGRLSFEFEGATDRAIFAQLAEIQEVFEEAACGCCRSTSLRYEVREFDAYKYYKLLCTACGATLDFGQHKVGESLFPKRRDKDGNDLPNDGWYVYRAAGPDSATAGASPFDVHRKSIETARTIGELQLAWGRVPPDLAKVLAVEKDRRKEELSRQR